MRIIKIHSAATRETVMASSASRLPLAKWLSLMALAALLGCSKEKSPTFEPPPSPKVEGEKVIFLTNAPQLASIAVQAAQARTTAVTHVTGRLYWNEDTTVGVFTPVAGRVIAIAG